MYFGKLVLESDEQEFSLRRVKNISSHPGRHMLKRILKVRNAYYWHSTGKHASSNFVFALY